MRSPRVLAVLAVFLLLPASRSFAATCDAGDTRLCLQGGRFQVEVAWTVPGLGSGPGHAVPLTGDTGTFWFFDNSNVELVVKVLDGRPANGHFWVYYGALSDVPYTVTVTDVQTGEKEIYDNPAGRLVSRADTVAFTAEPTAQLIAKLSPVPGGPVPPSSMLRRGPELQFNVTTAGLQHAPSVALGPDGRFMVTWSGEGQTPDGDALGRFYDSEGRPLSGEVSLNTSPGSQYGARAAASPTGEYMAVWFDYDQDRIVGRVFDAGGQPLGNEFAVSSPSSVQLYLSIVTDPAGGFLVAWFDGGSSNPAVPSSVRWQRFNRLGQRVGVEKAFNRHGLEVNVAASPAGGFVLVWTEHHPVFISEDDVLALVLDAEGRPLDNQAIRVTTTADGAHLRGRHGAPVPVFHSDGGFSVAWQTSVFGEPGTFVRRYDAQGQPDGPVTSLPGPVSFDSPPALAALPSGETLMLWNDNGQSQDPDSAVFGQIFDGSWNPVGGRSRINTYTEYAQTEPALAVSATGDVVAAWSSGLGYPQILAPPGYGLGTQDGDLLGVFGQRFTLATCALDATQLCLGGRFRVEVRFTDPRTGQPGAARAIPLTSDTGAFWFFGEENVELVLKVLDGRAVNGRFWIYQGALSDVQYTITVTDTLTHTTKTYNNPRGRLASRADIGAF